MASAVVPAAAASSMTLVISSRYSGLPAARSSTFCSNASDSAFGSPRPWLTLATTWRAASSGRASSTISCTLALSPSAALNSGLHVNASISCQAAPGADSVAASSASSSSVDGSAQCRSSTASSSGPLRACASTTCTSVSMVLRRWRCGVSCSGATPAGSATSSSAASSAVVWGAASGWASSLSPCRPATSACVRCSGLSLRRRPKPLSSSVMTGPKALPCWYGEHCASAYCTGWSCGSACIACRRSVRSRRDLPMPASPRSSIAWPRPCCTRAQRDSSRSTAEPRPTKGNRPSSPAAARRDWASVAPSTR